MTRRPATDGARITTTAPPSAEAGACRAPRLVLALTATLVACGGPTAPVADLVLTNGTIVTVDETRPEAEAVAILDDTILAVGSNEEIGRRVGDRTRVIDLEGRLAVPGFIESHGHFMGLGAAQVQLDLLDTGTWSEIVSQVDSAAREARPGQWIRGRGWHQEKWTEAPARTVEGFPTLDRLDEVAPDNPVVLTHASGHAVIANSAALRAAGIGPDTPNPEGGEILRDSGGRATGILVDAAEELVGDALDEARAERSPGEVREDLRRQAILAAREALRNGVTTFHDMGASYETIDMLREMAASGDLPPIRLYLHVAQGEVTPEREEELAAHRVVGEADDHVTVRAIGEISADGALGSRSAWMLEPYSDMPGSTGLEVTPVERIREIAEIGLRNGFQIATHAIGDRANHEVLDIYGAVFREHGVDGDTLRWRDEHSQHLAPEDIPRFEELGVIASMQGIHACSDWPYVETRLGEQRAREGAYVWQSLWETGAVVTNGTDAPVERVNPIPSFHCSVARRMAGSDSTFYPSQALTREQALRSYTLNGAHAAFEESRKGSITPGKLADITVLSRNIMTVPEDRIPGTEPVYTIVGGEVTYDAAESQGDSAGG